MESLFAGPAVDLTQPGVLWHGDFRPVSEIPPPIKHAAGYSAFADLLISTNQDPAALAADTRLLVDHLRQHRDSLRAADNDLLDSAGYFLGNSLIARVEDGRWQHMPPGELEVTQGTGGAVVLQMVRAILNADDHRMHEFDGFLEHWDRSAAATQVRSAAERTAERQLQLLQTPVVPSVAFEAPRGTSLVGLLRALVAYLTTHYRATASSGTALPDDPSTFCATVETIRVQPASPDSTPLVIAIDDVGAIAMRAGAFSEFFFYDPNAAELEDALLAIAAGLYRETCSPEPDGIAGYHLGSINRHGGSSGRGPINVTARKRAAIATQLNALPNGWTPWPLQHPHP